MIELTGDIPELAMEWRNHPDIWSWCRQNNILTQADQDRWLERIKNDSSIQMYGIRVLPDRELVGVCGLTSINYHHRTAEFSLYIAPEHQGNGYGTLALKGLLDYGFNRLNLQCIWGEVMEENPALEIFLKIGFALGTKCRSRYFKERKYINSYQIDMLASEYNERYYA